MRTPDVPRRPHTRALLVLLSVLALAVTASQPGWSSLPQPAAVPPPPGSAPVVTPDLPAPPAPVVVAERHSNWAGLAFLPESAPQAGAVRITPLYGKETLGLQVRLRF